MSLFLLIPRRTAAGLAFGLLLLLPTACVRSAAPARGERGLVFWAPRLPLAEGLFDTFEIFQRTDDCGRAGIPGLDCTMKKWDFAGTTLEVELPPGFELVGQGQSKNYWFSVRCVSGPASGKAWARVMAGGEVRYEGATELSCLKAASARFEPTAFYGEGAGGFTDNPSDAERQQRPLPVVLGTQVHTELTLHASDGTRLFGYGWEFVSPTGRFGLEEPPAPPTSPGLVPVGPRVVALAPGKAPRLRVGAFEAELPIEAVADKAWKPILEWKTDAQWTRVQVTARLGKERRALGLGGCGFRITHPQGTRESASPGACTTQMDVGHATRVCVSVRGREVCR